MIVVVVLLASFLPSYGFPKKKKTAQNASVLERRMLARK